MPNLLVNIEKTMGKQRIPEETIAQLSEIPGGQAAAKGNRLLGG